MIVAPTPPNEACRLAALHQLKILDTPPEERFDRITRLARRLFDVPIALVSLVDADRQWFKSRAGLDATETPRAISFCGHAIVEGDVMVVPDAAADVRFKDNPLVVAPPHVRFYAGCPLRAGDGHAIGTLCIIDRKPRQLRDDDLMILKDLAGAVEQQLVDARTVTTDHLTGLVNRRGLTVAGDYLVGLANHSRISLIILFFDLDGFKAINDVHGHASGDAALVEFSRALVRTFRDSDIVCRLGGDEFCVVMTGAQVSDSAGPLARLDVALRRFAERHPFEIAYSVGVIPFDPGQHASIDDVLRAADREMYREKRGKLQRLAHI